MIPDSPGYTLRLSVWGRTVILVYFSSLTCASPTGIKFLKSRRGKVIMMVNTFPFCEESKLRDKVIWRCTSKKTNCKARIHMLGSNVVAVKGMHNHPPRALCLPPRRPNARKGVEPISTPVSVTAPVTTLDALALQSPEIEWTPYIICCVWNSITFFYFSRTECSVFNLGIFKQFRQ